MKKKLLLIACFICAIQGTQLFAQGSYIPATGIQVSVSGVPLKNPWVGGFSAPIFSEIDLNGDGIKDLFVFDKDGNRITTYINNGTPNQVDYVFAPEYKTKFPKDLRQWVLLKDFDCDGKEDILAYSSLGGGIEVYKNNYTVQGGLKFTLVHNLVFSKYGSISANLYVAPVNLPVLMDVDFDGDMDILTFPVSGNYVEYHQNKAMELYGRCDTLVFEIQPNCFGNFGLSGQSNSAILGVSCRLANPEPPVVSSSPDQIQHAGSCMIALDIDGDNDYDLLNGDILGDNLLLVYNGGTSSGANMISQDTSFPSYDVPVDLFTFPAPYYLDVNNDGHKDLIVAPCIYGPSENFNHVLYYKNTTNNSSNVFNLQTNRFLVDEMIEVGSGAKVVFHDVDSDGLMDIVIGNDGYYSDILPFTSGLSWYKNIGNATVPAFEFQTDNFGNFFSLGLTGLAPAFGDIDNDGDADLFLGNTDGTIVYYTNTAGPGNLPVYTLTQASLVNSVGSIIDVGQFSTPQLVDVNKDGKLDLLIGERNGNINYYENTGTPSAPQFTFVTDNFGGINVTSGFNLYGYSYPLLYDSAGTSQLLVGTVSGYIYQYNNIDNNLGGIFNRVDSTYHGIYEPTRITVAVADLDGNGILEILTGNNTGGVTMYKFDSSSGLSHQLPTVNSFSIYPNPATDNLLIKFNTSEAIVRTIILYDIAGRMVDEQTTNSNVVMFDVAHLSSGMYHCKVVQGTGVTTGKFIVR